MDHTGRQSFLNNLTTNAFSIVRLLHIHEQMSLFGSASSLSILQLVLNSRTGAWKSKYANPNGILTLVCLSFFELGMAPDVEWHHEGLLEGIQGFYSRHLLLHPGIARGQPGVLCLPR